MRGNEPTPEEQNLLIEMGALFCWSNKIRNGGDGCVEMYLQPFGWHTKLEAHICARDGKVAVLRMPS